jgi:hypothetical protein
MMRPVLLAASLALVAAACASGSHPTAGLTGPEGGLPGVTASAAALASVTPSAAKPTTTVAAASAGPPASGTGAAPGLPSAALDGPVGNPVNGDLGTYTWDGFASEAPWVVAGPPLAAAPGSALWVSFGATAPLDWRAAWARVVGGVAGTPVGAAYGAGGAAAIRAPGTAGAWSLRVTASFGAGRNATWYWRVAVGP